MQRLNNTVADDELGQALATIRCAKNLFWWLIVLAILVQLTAFVMVHFVGFLDAPAAASQPTSQPVANQTAKTFEIVLGWALPAGRFIALVLCLLLVLTLLLAVKLALHGQTGGVAGFLSAFFWSLVLLMVLIPWQQVLPGSTFVSGATHNLGELLGARAEAAAADASLATVVLYYAKFLAFPALALALLVIVCRKFSRGYRAACGVEIKPLDVVLEPTEKM